MASIPESFENNNNNKNPISLDHIIPPDFKNILKLPTSHIWTPSPDDHHPLTNNSEPVPIVDLASPDALALTAKASEKWGIFHVTNHGIPVNLLSEVEVQTRKLFELPVSQKLLAVRSPEGLTGYGLARMSPYFPKQMWHEGFTIMGSADHHARQLWPHGHHITFCTVMDEYQKQLKALTERIIGLLFKSLGLTQDDVKWLKPKNGSITSQAVLQLNSYPVCPDPGHAMGLAPHTDTTLLTLLYQSNTSGLEVLDDSNGWVTVQPLPGALVVNIGDLMHIISNGRFKSVLHKAVVNQTHHRISLAYFYGPPMDAKVSPAMKLVDPDHPPLYRPVTWKGYLDAKKKDFYKALGSIKYDVNDKNECN
ncbi:hypothetical protein Tsubulata_009691 [Turnera subulata]|uniref:gibberellin 3beta-dioxygenase n=1 Tax=Turnera subulata TaxID=218843 RepID=A0A9Q0JED5_9ROSI|nr:hypothetical protein Tsubulata_009691 [Turnera subulata]